MKQKKWIVSYDNVDPIRQLYREYPHIVYELGYSARKASTGSEIMYFQKGLKIPEPVGPIKVLAA